METSKAVKSLIVKVYDGVYVGNSHVSVAEMKMFDISAIIRLEQLPPNVSFDIFEYTLPSQELLDFEVAPVVKKLNTICDDIQDLKDARRNVLLQCEDGRNKSLLVAGYYMIKRAKQDAVAVVNELVCVYFDANLTAAENDDRIRRNNLRNGVEVPISERSTLTAAARSELRGLTNRSFRRILCPGSL